MNSESTEDYLDKDLFENEIEKPYFNKPSLIKRIKSMIADTVVIVILMFIASFVLNNLNVESGMIRGITLAIILLYEPLLTSFNRTIGQKIVGIRVRKYNTLIQEGKNVNINLAYSFIRYLTKIFFGWISLITIHSNHYGKAIHDTIGNSVMTYE